MALLTDGIAKRWFQVGRVDDRHVQAVDDCRSCAVKLTRPMTTLTADRMTSKDRLSITVDRTRDRLDLVRVAEEARRLDRPVEVAV
jgi:hypothetical protein